MSERTIKQYTIEKNGFRVEKQLVRVINDAELKEYLMIKNR